MKKPRYIGKRDWRHPLLVVLALVVVALAVTAIIASSGKHSTSTATKTPTAVPTGPAIPCPTSGGKGSTTGKATSTTTTTSTASSTQGATWTGVFERVTAQLDQTGATKQTPRQLTRVSAEGDAPITVAVPMSSSGLRRRSKGKKPSFADGAAQIKLDPSGTSAQELDSEYTGALPVAVKVSYKLDGKSVSERDLRRKSGTVEVDYQLTNTTTKPVTVCFNGFNGQLAKETVQTPIPIVAHLSLTVPKSATTFHAPGAALSPARKGVDVGWTAAMFKPLGPTTRTFELTMTTSKAHIPESHLLIETLGPLALTGAVPAKSASVVGQAAAAAHSATAKVQSDVAALELKAGQPRKPRGSSRRGGRSGSSRRGGPSGSSQRGGRSRSSQRGGRSRSTSTSRLSFGTPTSDLTGMKKQIDRLGKANRTLVASVNRPTRKLLSGTRGSIDGLAASTSQSIDGSTATVNRSIERLNSSIHRSIGGLTNSTARAIARLTADLHKSTDTASLNEIAASAARLRVSSSEIKNRTDAVAAELAQLTATVDDLVARLPAPAQNAALLVARLAAVKADLGGATTRANQTDPAFLKLAADVVDAQTVAAKVSSALTDVQQRAQAVAGAMHTLQTDVLTLQTRINALEAAAAANAEGAVQSVLATSVQGVTARIAGAEAAATQAAAKAGARAQRALSGHGRRAKRSVGSAGDHAKRSVGSAVSQAKQSVASAKRSARLAVRSAERSTRQTLASVQRKAARALASAKQKAKQGGQADLAAAQAAADQAEASAQKALATANADFARLLTTNERAAANQLPGGDAPGVTEQNGSFRYVIAGS